jgi:sporulation protein YabP
MVMKGERGMNGKMGTELPHHVIMEGRARLTVSGVEEVESFDENSLILVTSKGLLLIKGSGLSVDKLSIDKGELSVEGTIDLLQYEDQQSSQSGFWSRLFR